MDSQRPLLYMSLIFVAFLIWQAWQTDHQPQPQPGTQQNAAQAQFEGAVETDPPKLDLPEAAQAPASAPTQAKNPSKTPAGQSIVIKTDVLELTINTRGGDVTSAKLPTYPVSLDEDSEPFQLFTTEGTPYVAQSGLLHDKNTAGNQADRAPNHYAIYQAEQAEYILSDNEDQLMVTLRWTAPDGVEVHKVFGLERGSFVVTVRYDVINRSDLPWVGRAYYQLRHGPVVQTGSKYLGTHHYTGAAYFADKYHKLPFTDMAETPLGQSVNGGWVSMVQHYFLSAWVPVPADSQNFLYSKVLTGSMTPEYLIGIRGPALELEPGAMGQLEQKLYVGPKLQQDLEALAPGLELTADYGMFTIFSKPLFWLLSKIHGFLGNWGWSIIVLTILIKLVFYKLSETSYRSMARMRKVAPKLQALKERHGDNKQAQQQAMMDLYRTEKINPLGGCLPILIQIPVFIALYWVLNESVELRQASWLWIKDLSLKDPLFILPVVMGIGMFVQQKLNPPQPDPMMQKVLTAMPLVFTVFFAFFPAGLVLYWVVNSLLSIAQQWYITRAIEAETK
ncbi:MAG: membrane protein insertase YidC [Thiotrichales bacterium]